MSDLEKSYRQGADMRVALSSGLRQAPDSPAPSQRSGARGSTVIRSIAGRASRPLRRFAAGLPARAKVFVRPYLVPLRRFFLATVEDEMRRMRSEVEDLRRSSGRAVIPSGNGEVLIRTAVGYVICDANDFEVLASLVDGGEMERGTRLLIERVVRPGDTVVDVGAHIGMHTLAAARALQGRGSVHAFEPYGPSAARLRRALAVNGLAAQVEVHEAAVADAAGHKPLHLGQVSGHHSLYPLGAEASGAAAETVVTVVTLDEALRDVPSPSLIKIDVEGAERAVIAGARSLLARSPNAVLIVEFGPSHLLRVGDDPEAWFADFEALGLIYRAIDPETGRLRERSRTSLLEVDSMNLAFAKPDAPVWLRAGVG
jgi:FkbM family methyltransferase